jgi:hypothetical protein
VKGHSAVDIGRELVADTNVDDDGADVANDDDAAVDGAAGDTADGGTGAATDGSATSTLEHRRLPCTMPTRCRCATPAATCCRMEMALESGR